MTKYPDIQCPNARCRKKIPITLDKCPSCKTFLGAPNVRMAEIPEERSELEARYNRAVSEALSKGNEPERKALEQKLEHSVAVINMSTDFVKQMLISSASLYSTYQAQVGAGTRKPAALENDQKRLGVEGFLFGSFGKDIVYAALSADGYGLESYGEMHVTLSEATIEQRSSLMEVNSFFFFQEHALAIAQGNPPLGYRSNWGDRAKLGVAKLAGKLESSMDDAKLNALILSSDGDRSHDNFIEIHIFESFDNGAIAKISCRPAPPKQKREANLVRRKIEELAKSLGIGYESV
jgi:hypothetical protein